MLKVFLCRPSQWGRYKQYINIYIHIYCVSVHYISIFFLGWLLQRPFNWKMLREKTHLFFVHTSKFSANAHFKVLNREVRDEIV